MKTMTRFPLEELARLPIIVFPRVSPDGTRVAYYSDVSGRMEIWVLDLEPGAARQVSDGQIPRGISSPFVWNQGGTMVVYGRDQGGNEQHDLWLLDMESSNVRQLTDTPNAQEIALDVGPEERVSFVSTRNGQLDLYSMRLDGSEVVQLTSLSSPFLAGGQWSPDGSALIGVWNETGDSRNSDVFVVPPSRGDARKVLDTGRGNKDVAVSWSPDGRSIAVGSDFSGVERAGILDLESGQVRWLGNGESEETPVEFSPDGQSLLVVRNRDAVLGPVVYDLATGTERVPVLPGGASLALTVDAGFARGGAALVLRYSTDATRPELALYDLEGSETRILVPAEYGSIDPGAFVPAEDIHYPSFDGRRIHALLYRPHEIPDSELAPSIVIPHGGPTSQYFHGFSVYIQFLVNEGYVVLAPNIRGSTGYGVEFRDLAVRDWGGADLEDIVAGREYLANLPFVDSTRIAIFGISYGGYMTYIAATKAADKWRAAAAWVGITDLPALYDESMPHFKYYLQQQMGDPEKDAELWRDRSAVNFADRTQAKLLIIHGINDPRCPISQARIFRDRLVAAGKVEGRDFEYVELGEEGHGSTDQEQRLRAFHLLADFLASTL